MECCLLCCNKSDHVCLGIEKCQSGVTPSDKGEAWVLWEISVTLNFVLPWVTLSLWSVQSIPQKDNGGETKMHVNKLFTKKQMLEVTVDLCRAAAYFENCALSTVGYENLRLRKYFLAQICANILINNCVYNNCNLLYSLTARAEPRANLKKK